MARFLALYRSSTSAQEQMANVTPEQAQAGIEAWQAWAAKAGTAIVDLGAPVSGGQRLRLAGSLARRPPRGRQTPLPQLSEQAQAMVPGQHLEAIWLLGAGAGDRFSTSPNCSIDRRIFSNRPRETRFAFHSASTRRPISIWIVSSTRLFIGALTPRSALSSLVSATDPSIEGRPHRQLHGVTDARSRTLFRPMARRTFLIVDQDGTQVAALKALRDQWTPGEQLTVRGRLYQVVSIVQLEQPDSSGATAMLIVEEPPS